MQLLSSSAGEKDRKKLVSLQLWAWESLVWWTLDGFSRSGSDECDGSDAPDGLQAHQHRQGEDDDDAAHRPPIQGRLPSAVLPVSISVNIRKKLKETFFFFCHFDVQTGVFFYYSQNMGLFCEERGTITPRASAQSCNCCPAAPDPSAAQRNWSHHPFPYLGEQAKTFDLLSLHMKWKSQMFIFYRLNHCNPEFTRTVV